MSSPLCLLPAARVGCHKAEEQSEASKVVAASWHLEAGGGEVGESGKRSRGASHRLTGAKCQQFCQTRVEKVAARNESVVVSHRKANSHANSTLATHSPGRAEPRTFVQLLLSVEIQRQ